MSEKKIKLSIEVTPVIAEELRAITNRLGIKDTETLISNYLREVILASRVDQATLPIRKAIASNSSDLNMLGKIDKKK